MDYTNRFDGKGEIYAKARAKYAAVLFDFLKNDLKAVADSIFADIGSSTGIFTEQLLNCGYKVFAIEEEKLSDNKGFVSVTAVTVI